jgi:hypothetical protein
VSRLILSNDTSSAQARAMISLVDTSVVMASYTLRLQKRI